MKIKKIFKKYGYFFLSFALPLLICVTILGMKGIIHNIDKIYTSDLSGQHLEFLNYLKGIMLGKNSLEYSYYAGMGSPMLATMIFYCVSPFNILLILIDDIQWAIIIIDILKISLSGLTMFILLKNKTKRNNYMTLAFSTSYAVSSFVINYFFCVFWFDSVYLAPLVMLGIDKMYKYEKINYLYIFSLSLAIICNIQMGFGLCVYSVIYFLYLFNIKYSIFKDFNKFKKLGGIFAISSLCAGGISSGILLGFLSEIKHIVGARDGLYYDDTQTTNIFYVLKNIFTVGFVSSTNANVYEPYISSGLIVSYFIIFYFTNSKTSLKKKVHTVIVIMIFIISFSIGLLNNLWHITSPIILNYRYSIYLCLFLTTISYDSYVRKRKIREKDIKVLIGILSIILIIFLVFRKDIFMKETIIFTILVLLFSILTKNNNKKFEMVLFFVIISEIIVNGYVSLGIIPNDKFTLYDSMIELGNLNSFPDDYRVTYNYSYSDYSNDGFLLNKNSSLRYFSSVLNGDLANFFGRNHVYKGGNNYLVSAYNSPLLLSLLGGKYFYLESELNNNGLYKKIKSYKIRSYNYKKKKYFYSKVYLYENPYALSIGYVVDKDTKFLIDMDPADYQNSIIRNFSGIKKDVMTTLDWEYEENVPECSSEIQNNCTAFYIYNHTNNNLIYINRVMSSYYLSKDYPNYVDISSALLIQTIDKEIELLTESTYNNDQNPFYASTCDKHQLIESLTSLQNNMLYNVKVDKNVMSGEIDSNRDGILFLSIPYDNRFKVYVDGKKSKYYSLLDDTFMGLDITKGKHKIVLKYSDSDNYKWYILSSSIFIVITFVVKHFINRLFDKS